MKNVRYKEKKENRETLPKKKSHNPEEVGNGKNIKSSLIENLSYIEHVLKGNPRKCG